MKFNLSKAGRWLTFSRISNFPVMENMTTVVRWAVANEVWLGRNYDFVWTALAVFAREHNPWNSR